MYKLISAKKNKDGTLKHIIKEGAFYHVLWYDSIMGFIVANQIVK